MFLKTREEFVDNLLRLPVGVRRRIRRHSEDGQLGELIDQIDHYLQIMLFSRDKKGREVVCIQKSVQKVVAVELAGNRAANPLITRWMTKGSSLDVREV